MSSVEQKIREVLENISGSGGVKSIAIDQATQSILQIIESDVIGEDQDIMQIPLPDGRTRSAKYDTAHQHFTAGKNTLRAEQRANLREDK